MFLSFKIQSIEVVLKFMPVVMRRFDVLNKLKAELKVQISNTSMSLLLYVML